MKFYFELKCIENGESFNEPILTDMLIALLIQMMSF